MCQLRTAFLAASSLPYGTARVRVCPMFNARIVHGVRAIKSPPPSAPV